MSFPRVQNIDGTSLAVSDGLTLPFPSVTSYSHAPTANNQTRTF